jgi:hypothetical protein
MHQQPIDVHVMSHRLWRQALSGDPDGALLALEQMDLTELTVLSADLLARLYVRAGRLAEARTLWHRILQADPAYSPAVKALNKLDSAWLAWTVAKKYSLWFGAAVVAFFALYGLGVCFAGGGDVPIALMGITMFIAMLGVYLAGLFGWACVIAASLFGSDRSSNAFRTQPRRGRVYQTTGPYASGPQQER